MTSSSARQSLGSPRSDSSASSSIVSYDSTRSPTSSTTTAFETERFQQPIKTFSISTDYSAVSILRHYQNHFPLHHVLVLNYQPSVGNLQIDGSLSELEIAEAQLPKLAAGEGKDPNGVVEEDGSKVVPKEESGRRRFDVHVFQSGRFKFEPGFQSPETYELLRPVATIRSLTILRHTEPTRIISL